MLEAAPYSREISKYTTLSCSQLHKHLYHHYLAKIPYSYSVYILCLLSVHHVFQPCRWRQHGHPKRWYLITTLHGPKIQKNASSTFTAVKTSNLEDPYPMTGQWHHEINTSITFSWANPDWEWTTTAKKIINFNSQQSRNDGKIKVAHSICVSPCTRRHPRSELLPHVSSITRLVNLT
jgi:hypothetical protein